jgi:hypothetical protein
MASTEEKLQFVACDPQTLLHWAGRERIVKTLEAGRITSTAHSLRSAESFQITSLCESIITATTTELLSNCKHDRPHLGFCYAVLRSMGESLLAWNYPILFTELLESSPTRYSLEDNLHKRLGFSVNDLTSALLPESSNALNEPSLLYSPDTWNPNEEYYQVGRIFSRGEISNGSSKWQMDWKGSISYLTSFLGTSYAGLIRKHLNEIAQSYAETAPPIADALRRFNLEPMRDNSKPPLRRAHNSYLQQCQPLVQSSLRALYAEMPNGRPEPAIVKTLLNDVIPQAGFTGGCLYVMNVKAQVLSPRKVFGNVRGRNIGPVQLSPTVASFPSSLKQSRRQTSQVQSSKDSVAAALASERPIVELASNTPQSSITQFSGILGKRMRIGVLYLERPDLTDATDGQSLVTYQAINQTLCDALLID